MRAEKHTGHDMRVTMISSGPDNAKEFGNVHSSHAAAAIPSSGGPSVSADRGRSQQITASQHICVYQLFVQCLISMSVNAVPVSQAVMQAKRS